MKISSIYIDGFGIFHNESLLNLNSSPFTLFYGNNEAGKSTILGFFRSILFGFPRINSRGPKYPVINGGNLGGHIVLISEGGIEYVIERKVGPSGGNVRIRSSHETNGTPLVLPQILNGMSADVFKNVYAFGLPELQTLSSLNGENVRNAIYGASTGTGMLSFPRAQKKIKEKLENLFKPGGRNPLINTKIAELEIIMGKIREATQNMGKYDSIFEEVNELNEKIELAIQPQKVVHG